MSYQAKTPILIIAFNRPALTLQLLEIIRKVRPAKLYIVVDGPRAAVAGEVDLRDEVVTAIERQVDWQCVVKWNISRENLGCGVRVSSGLDWGFSCEERLIVLEDDCHPNISFFKFCDELLEYYADDDRVGAITGDNFQRGIRRSPDAYYFSIYNHCWGWASWRRAWHDFDLALSTLDDFERIGGFVSAFPHWRERRYWRKILAKVKRGELDTWDYSWSYACWASARLTCTPVENLVRNVGFSSGSHFHNSRDPLANMETRELEWPLKHPRHVTRHYWADRFAFNNAINLPIRKKISRRFGKYL